MVAASAAFGKMKPNPKHPWCIRCRVAMWKQRVSQTGGGREFRCPKCGKGFFENSYRNREENKVQDARWLLAAGLSQREVCRRLKCGRPIVKRAVERYGLHPIAKTLVEPKPFVPVSRVWPYGETDPLITLVNNAVPRDMAEDMREEVAQSMLLAIMEILAEPQRFVRQYFTARPWWMQQLPEETK